MSKGIDGTGYGFEPACESCGTGVAVFEVTAGGDTFDVCDGCVPSGRHIDVVRIEGGRRR